jgi:hypothetical protein
MDEQRLGIAWAGGNAMADQIGQQEITRQDRILEDGFSRNRWNDDDDGPSHIEEMRQRIIADRRRDRTGFEFT